MAWRIPPRFGTAPSLQAAARARNIAVYTVESGGGEEYGGRRYNDGWLLLGYAALSEASIRTGVDRLAHILDADGDGRQT